MEVIGLQIFVSLMLVLGSILLFAWTAKQRDHEHSDRLALLPLENDRTHPSLPMEELRLGAPAASPSETRPNLSPPHTPIDSDARGQAVPRAEVAHHGFEND